MDRDVTGDKFELLILPFLLKPLSWSPEVSLVSDKDRNLLLFVSERDLILSFRLCKPSVSLELRLINSPVESSGDVDDSVDSILGILTPSLGNGLLYKCQGTQLRALRRLGPGYVVGRG